MSLGQWLGLLSVVLSGYILWQIRQVLLLIFAAIVLATALNKLSRKLQQWLKIPRSMSVLAALLVFIGMLTGFFLIIVPPFISQFQELTSSKLPAVIQSASKWREQFQSYLPAQLLPYLPDIEDLNQQIQPVLQNLAGRSLVLFSSSLGVVLNLLFMLILTIMLLAQPNAYRQAFISLFPRFYRRRIDRILHDCEVSLGKWIVGALISMVVVALLSILGLVVLGIPLPLAQGILAGLLNFIPNIGPTMSVILPMAIALLDEPWKAPAIFIVYFLIQQFESNLLTPYIMAQQVSLLPAITLIAQVFFATFFGFLGFLLALPLTVVGKVWINAVLIEDVLDRWHQPHRWRLDDEIKDPWVSNTLSVETAVIVTQDQTEPTLSSETEE
jgi:predicted PurR-regulated permease PerM